MSAMGSGQKTAVFSNVYTVMLVIALAVVVASATYVAMKCSMDYNTLFNVAAP